MGMPEAKSGGRLRVHKQYPELLEYLGWCTWEQYKGAINEPLILEAIDQIDRSELPVRWILIDDGHLDQGPGPVEASAGVPEQEVPLMAGSRQLNRFTPEPTKFPHGWSNIQARIHRSPKLKWSGIWLNFNGYWGGIRPGHQLDAVADCLAEFKKGVLLPRDRQDLADRFYEEWIRLQAEAGFDFVKVDNQAQNVTLYAGHCANAVRASRMNHRALEKAVGRHLKTMINCMAHNNVCAFSTSFSQVTRCSEDYLCENLWRAKHHLHNSFGNMLWLGQTVWGDHDMFHSTDKVSAGLMARSKAISGGPIYLSDKPSSMKAELVRPLCDEQGKILRPLAPAVPLPESIFENPYEGTNAFQVVAPLENGACAWAAYNLTHPGHPVRARLMREHYDWGCRLNREKTSPAKSPKSVLAWDVKRQKAFELDDPYEEEITGFDDLFFLLLPIQNGWGLIGRADKFLSPHTFSLVKGDARAVTIGLKESGPLVFWNKARHVRSNLGEVRPAGPHLWKLDLPVGQALEVELTVETI